MLRPTVDQIVGFLQRTPVAVALAPSELAELVFIAQVVIAVPGQVIVRAGEPGDAWFVVMEGTVRVHRDGALLATLHPRDCFGELAVLDGEPRVASVTAETPATLIRVPRVEFEALLSSGSLAAHRLVLGLTRIVTRRLRGLLAELPAEADYEAVNRP
ncbi:MAG: cyclic nucleotide-binding domain-containing protein [Myxococcales bacterium]|nr:cyclic nucleotide-binding domain-containing protein [Myxococcales bacterium]